MNEPKEIVAGCPDCELELRALPVIHLSIKTNYGPQSLPVLAIRSERGLIHIPISNHHRKRLQAWGVPKQKGRP